MIQSDLFGAHPSVTILPVTSDVRALSLFRITVEPTLENGLNKSSQVTVHKPQSVGRDKVNAVVGHLDDAAMLAVNRALAVFLGLA